MSKGLEALERLEENIIFVNVDYEMKHVADYEIIERELNALEIIKNKKVNMFHIWVFDDYTQYKQHYPFSEYNAEEDMLAFEEFDFLKEWLENE